MCGGSTVYSSTISGQLVRSGISQLECWTSNLRNHSLDTRAGWTQGFMQDNIIASQIFW